MTADNDHEVHNLRLVMNEIFWEENFVGTLVLQTATDNNPTQINVEHEYMLVYARDLQSLPDWGRSSENAGKIQRKYSELKGKIGNDPAEIQRLLRVWIKENESGLELVEHYDNVDERGVFHDGDIANTIFGGYEYDVVHPVTGKPCRVPDKGYRFKPATMEKMLSDGDILFGSDETKLIKPKKRLENVRDALRSVIYEDGRASTKRLEAMFERGIFDNPKSETLLRRIVDFASDKGALVLDFFAGSGTTAQAVLELNKEDGGNRKFILVQLPEPTGRKDFPTIAEITKERVRRVIQKMNKEHAEDTERRQGKLDLDRSVAGSGSVVVPQDLGFKVLKLAASNFAVWDPALAPTDPDQLAKQWELTADNVRGDASEQALLHELMLKSGLPLTTSVELAHAASAPVYRLDGDSLLVCLARDITREALRAMIDLKPKSILCLDIGFKGNDALKVNAQLEFQSHEIQFHTA